MQFDEGGGLEVTAGGGALVADPFELLLDRASVRVLLAEHLVERQPSLVHGAAHHVGREAHALLVGEEAHRDRPGRLDLGLVQARDDFEAGQDAEVAVVEATGAHGVDVRSGQNGRCVLATLADPDHVPDPVDLDGEPEAAHPLADEVAPGAIRIRQGQATDASTGKGTDLAQLGQGAVQSGGIDSQALGLLRRHGC